MVRFSLSLLLLLASACTLELDQEISCGDGYVDRTAGEVCDPESPASFENACQHIDPSRTGACDPTTCRIDTDGCYPNCGNGGLDPGEECDPGSLEPDSEEPPEDDQQIGAELSCRQLDPLDGGGAYSGGILQVCNANCTWDRTPCHRCGDGKIRGDEVCDVGIPDSIDTDAYCLTTCVSPGEDQRPEVVRCEARCADDCQGYSSDDETRNCCIPSGWPTHPRIKCCSGFEEKGTCAPGLDGG